MPTILYTSLKEIESFNPCEQGWINILKGQEKTESDDVLFPLIDCLKSNTISDVCWLLGKRKDEIEICVKFAQDCADSVAHLKDIAAARYPEFAARSARSARSARYAEYAESAAQWAESAARYAECAEYAAESSASTRKKEENMQFLINRIREYEETH
jgi:hypothetical protein